MESAAERLVISVVPVLLLSFSVSKENLVTFLEFISSQKQGVPVCESACGRSFAQIFCPSVHVYHSRFLSHLTFVRCLPSRHSTSFCISKMYLGTKKGSSCLIQLVCRTVQFNIVEHKSFEVMLIEFIDIKRSHLTN